MVLQNTVSQTTIQHDILIFLKDAFRKIHNHFNWDPLLRTPLDKDWLSDKKLQVLVNMTVSLFIVAATVYHFVDDSDWDPQEWLKTILQFSDIEKLEQMTHIYLLILTQLSAQSNNSHNKDRLY